MCDLREDQKRKTIPVMLKGNDFRLYAKITPSEGVWRWDTVVDELVGVTGKHTRISNQWSRMKISDAFAKNPYMAEVDVFKDFSGTIMSLQQQIHTPFQAEMKLRDSSLTSEDIPTFQEKFFDRQTRTAHQPIERVANNISNLP